MLFLHDMAGYENEWIDVSHRCTVWNVLIIITRPRIFTYTEMFQDDRHTERVLLNKTRYLTVWNSLEIKKTHFFCLFQWKKWRKKNRFLRSTCQWNHLCKNAKCIYKKKQQKKYLSLSLFAGDTVCIQNFVFHFIFLHLHVWTDYENLSLWDQITINTIAESKRVKWQWTGILCILNEYQFTIPYGEIEKTQHIIILPM